MHAIYFGLARSLFTGQKLYFYMINTKNFSLKEFFYFMYMLSEQTTVLGKVFELIFLEC